MAHDFSGLGSGSGSTTGTGTATLLSVPAPTTGRVMRMEARYVGREANGDGVSLMKVAVFKNVAGTVSRIGSILDVVAGLGDLAVAGVSVNFTINGTNIDITATGVLTKTIAWTVDVNAWAV